MADSKDRKNETEKVAPGFKVSSNIGSGIANDRKATKKEREEGDYTTVVNLSND